MAEWWHLHQETVELYAAAGVRVLVVLAVGWLALRYLAAPLGAAAVASRLLGLSTEATAHALAAAITLTSGASGRARAPSSRWLTLGCAAQNGVLAALGARRGLRGDEPERTSKIQHQS